jgi:hypothetical protein
MASLFSQYAILELLLLEGKGSEEPERKTFKN